MTARRPGDRPPPPWQTWAALGFVVFSLLALAILPGTVARRVDRLQREVAQRVTPVRNELHAFGLAFAREVLAFRAWALTGDTSYAAEYKRSAEEADRSLDTAARDLSGTDLAPLAAELRSTLGGWREMVRQIMESRIGRADPLADLSNQQRRVDAVLELLSRLDRRLGGWEEATARRMQSESRRQAVVSLFLAAVALAATVVVALLSAQSRRLARQLRDRAQEERALRDVAEHERKEKTALLESTAQGMWGVDRAGRATFVNTAAAKMLGFSAEEVLGRAPHSLVHHTRADGTPYPESECPMTRVMATRERVIIAGELLWRKDGTSFLSDYSAAPIIIGDEVHGAVVAFTDATERHRREREMRESEEQFRALAENAAAAILVIRHDDTIVFANPATHRVFGYGPDELLGRPLTSLMPPDLRDSHRHGVRRFLATGRRHLRWEGVELVGLRKDGVVVPLEITMGTFVRDGVPYFVGIAQDITARKQAETERIELLDRERAAREKAEAAVHTRDEVLAIVSHDLRNPLNTISLAVGTLESGEVPAEEGPRTIQVIRRAVDRMNRLIADLLDVAKLEAGQKLAVQAAPIDIGSVVGETCDGLAAEAGRKGQHLDCQLEEGLPEVMGDKHRLIQVLANLVGNALKFTGEGGHVGVSAKRDGGDVVVAVADSGPGVAPEHLAQVFNPYWQARQTARLGAGLGLAIAKGIVEAHGGRIWATSTPGTGSTFAFSLPPLSEKPAAATAGKDAAAQS